MNKSQLIETLSNQFGNRKTAKHALETVIDTITRELARGEKVAITGFGAFEKHVRPARMVRNPRTGERTRAKKTAVPKFRPGAELKAVVSGEKKPAKVVSTAAKSTSAKKTTTSSAAKKSAGSKTTASKSTAKKTTAKKSTAKKSPAKKSTAKKSTAKKSPAKKSTAKKTAKKS